MKVLIDGRYAYETDLDDVEVGDEMALPGSGVMVGTWHGIVTELEPDYSGRCTYVLGLSRRKAKVEAENNAKAEVRITGLRVGDEIEKPCRRDPRSVVDRDGSPPSCRPCVLIPEGPSRPRRPETRNPYAALRVARAARSRCSWSIRRRRPKK